ncbi:MAG: ABC transporter substrate-binding protein [Betaproteobacteria bacterium]|nr:ABC transporter substrate-binding protein [Betaproteobacteria bacterium]
MRSVTAKLHYAVLLLAFAAAGARAAAQEPGPEQLVRTVTNDVLESIHGDKALQAGDKRKALALAERKILPHVDFRAATRMAVGHAWTEATPEQKTELVRQFRSMLVRIYSNAIGTYRGQTMRVLPVHMAPGATDVTVRNEYLKPGAQPVPVDYAMHRTAQGWKIYDITVAGVSLVTTYRGQFEEVVRQSGVQGLISRMEQKNRPTALQ